MTISVIALLRHIDEKKAVVSKDDEINALEINIDDESDDDHNYRELFCLETTNDIDLRLDEHIVSLIE